LTNAGIAWFSIEYRLARGADLNSLISLEGLAALRNASDDVRNAIEYIRKHAAEWSIDTTRIALIGESAGAHLASMAGLRPAPTAPVQAVVAFYSPSDLAALIESSPSIPDRLRNMLKGTALEAILLGGLRQLSPVNLVSADAPPFLLIHGTADSLVPFAQSEAMCAALRTAMDICELFPVPGGEHGFNRWEGQGTMPAYKEKMISWLKTALRLE
jgi:acetyl esterase/lipase